MRRWLSLFLSILICSISASAHGAKCDMSNSFETKNSVRVWYNNTGIKAYYFRENSDVNTDGSGRSYHPDDLSGSKGLAQNSICNGFSRRVGNRTVDCLSKANCQACLNLFRSLPRDKMLANFSDYFKGFAIAQSNGAACIVPEGEANAGFFVSTTRYERKDKPVCDQSRYLDAAVFPAIAIPERLYKAGVKMGDYVLVRNRKNGRSIFGVVYDTSGSRIGESSIAMNRLLLCQKGKPNCEPPPMPTNLMSSYALVVEDADYLIFAQTVKSWPSSPKAIEEEGRKIFADWGGKARLDSCAESYVRRK